MTYKPKRNPKTYIYQNDPEKFSSNGESKLSEGETEKFLSKVKIGKKSDRVSHTEYFLANGETADGSKKKLKNVFESQKKVYGSLGIKNKIKDLLFGGGMIINKNPDKKAYYKEYIKAKEDIRDEFIYDYIMNEEDKKKIKENAIPIKQIIKKYKELRKLKKIKTKNNPEILKYFETVKIVCERYGIIISDEVLDLNLYEYNDQVLAYPDDPENKKKGLGGVAYTSKRGIIIPKNDKKRFVKVLFHELAHHIGEGGRGYMGLNYDGLFINEAFTEFLGYEFLKEYNGNNTKIKGGYPYQIIAIGKLIDLAAKRLNKPVEDVYRYMMRGYLIKGFKGLNLFYKAFGRDFLGYEGINIINEGDTTYIETEYKGLLSIGPKPTDIKGFVNLIKIYCWDLGFDTLQDALEYFDYHNKPSEEISNIMGIKRANKKYISKKSKMRKNKKIPNTYLNKYTSIGK